MATQKQIVANQRNAQKSTGPRTTAGKAKSSRNALKTGIYADDETALPCEDPLKLQDLQREYYACYAPATPAQRCLVDALVRDEWLLRRFAMIEGQLLTDYWVCRRDCDKKTPDLALGITYDHLNSKLEGLQRRINATRKAYLTTLAAVETRQAAMESEAPGLDPARSQPPDSFPEPIGFVPPLAPTPDPSTQVPPAELLPPHHSARNGSREFAIGFVPPNGAGPRPAQPHSRRNTGTNA